MNNLVVLVQKVGKNNIEELGSPDKFLQDNAYLFGESAAFTGELSGQLAFCGGRSAGLEQGRRTAWPAPYAWKCEVQRAGSCFGMHISASEAKGADQAAVRAHLLPADAPCRPAYVCITA